MNWSSTMVSLKLSMKMSRKKPKTPLASYEITTSLCLHTLHDIGASMFGCASHGWIGLEISWSQKLSRELGQNAGGTSNHKLCCPAGPNTLTRLRSTMNAKSLQQFSGIQMAQTFVQRLNFIDIFATGNPGNILSCWQRIVGYKSRRQTWTGLINDTME